MAVERFRAVVVVLGILEERGLLYVFFFDEGSDDVRREHSCLGVCDSEFGECPVVGGAAAYEHVVGERADLLAGARSFACGGPVDVVLERFSDFGAAGRFAAVGAHEPEVDAVGRCQWGGPACGGGAWKLDGGWGVAGATVVQGFYDPRHRRAPDLAGVHRGGGSPLLAQ